MDWMSFELTRGCDDERLDGGGVGCGVLVAAAWRGRRGVAERSSSAADGTFTMKVQTDIVLTNVVVRDKKTGEVVKGLKASDFTILENGKPQKIASFDYQNVDEAAVLREKTTVTGKATVADLAEPELRGGSR